MNCFIKGNLNVIFVNYHSRYYYYYFCIILILDYLKKYI